MGDVILTECDVQLLPGTNDIVGLLEDLQALRLQLILSHGQVGSGHDRLHQFVDCGLKQSQSRGRARCADITVEVLLPL
jgi:hypothetical protein